MSDEKRSCFGFGAQYETNPTKNHNILEMRKFQDHSCADKHISKIAFTYRSQHLSSRRSKMVLPSVDYTAIFIYESQIPHALVWLRFWESIASLPSLG